MRKTILILLLSMFAFAQENTFTIKDLPYTKTDRENRFPLVVSPNAKIAEKINTFLQVLELERVPLHKSDPFLNTEYATFIEFDKILSPKNILSIRISKDGCGAYCEEYDAIYNFDAGSGDMVLLGHIFTKDGLKQISQKLTSDVREKIDAYVTTLENEADEINEAEDIGDQLSLYKNCGVYDIDIYTKFYFTQNSIVLGHGRCSNHAMRALDDLGDFEFEYSFDEIEKYLSSYGLSLLGDKTPVKNRSIEGKIFKGTLGKYPITLLIDRVYEDGSCHVNYWYDKNRVPIAWNGKIKDGIFELKEWNSEKEQSIADIKAKFENTKISGTWTNLNTDKSLPISLSEY